MPRMHLSRPSFYWFYPSEEDDTLVLLGVL